MANPAIVAIPKDAWLKVAAAVFTGFIRKMSNDPGTYYFTTRIADGLEPAVTNPALPTFEGVPVFLEGRNAEIAATESTDVWMFCTDADGKVRVDV